MAWQRVIIPLAMLLASLLIAGWQWHEYQHECAMAREAVISAADSLMNALVGGVRSHRRLGPFFSDQMRGMLDELARSEDVLAVALVSADSHESFVAGEKGQLKLTPPFEVGRRWVDAGLVEVRQVTLPREAGGPGSEGGRGYGGGRGWRRGEVETENISTAFLPGETATALLLVDRRRADQAIRRARWTRGLIVVASCSLVVFVALTWYTSVRLVQARGAALTLESESRHWRDLSLAAAGLAHETRNPLGLIRGWTQRLADDFPEGSRLRQNIQAVIEECDRLTSRINQFLAFARPSEPQPQHFDPADVVAELAVLLEPDLKTKNLSLRPIAGGETIRADRELFRQALFNLLQNAVQASPDNETIEVSLIHQRKGLWSLEVADRGSGVASDLVERLFTPYFTTRPDGNGLGLAIVRRIAVAHGWDAQYLPRPGGGAIFRLAGIQE